MKKTLRLRPRRRSPLDNLESSFDNNNDVDSPMPLEEETEYE